MTVNPPNYSREQPTSTPFIHVQYRGACSACETAVQATVRKPTASKQTDAWVRCTCGKVTHCEQSGTENYH